MDKEQILRELGLNEKEVKVYLAILELGSSSIQPIAVRAGVKRTSIYYFIDHLVDLGLVTQTVMRGRRYYQAQPPQKLLDIQEARLSQVKAALPQFLSLFNISDVKPKISYFEGTEQVKQIFLEETKCKRELVAIWSGSDVFEMVGQSFLDGIDKQRQANGAKVRVVRIPEKEAPFATHWPHGTAVGRELRYAPAGTEFPVAFTIYDTHKVSFVSAKQEGWGVLIESEDFERAMRVLFEAFWLQAKPAVD